MRAATTALKEAFNPNGGEGARFIDWEVSFEIIQTEIYSDLSASAAEDAKISRIGQVLQRLGTPIAPATYELGGFPLDGSVVVPPRTHEASDAVVGLYMNDISDADGNFIAPQVFTASTISGSAYNLIAVTLVWGAVVPLDFVVRWYNGATLLEDAAYTENTDSTVLINEAVTGVNRVTVTVTRTAPHHRVRLAEFIPGAIVQYDKSNSETLAIVEQCDPLSERVPAGTLKLSAQNIANKFNIFDPSGVYAYFRDRMVLNTRIGAMQTDGQYNYVQMNQHYLKAPRLTGNLSTIVLDGVNLIGVLDDTQYTTGIFKTATLSTFANDIAASAGVTISHPSRFSDITITAYIGTMSHAQAFRLIAQAGSTILSIGRDNTILFDEPEVGTPEPMTREDYRMENGLLPADKDIFNTVRIPQIAFTQRAAREELFKASVSGSLVSAVFYADNCIITTTDGVYHKAYDPSTGHTAAVAGGNVTVQGYILDKNVSIIERTIRQGSEAAFVYDKMKENPLVQSNNGNAVADYYLLHAVIRRRTAMMNYRGYPYLEMADAVSFDYGSGSTQNFLVTKNSLTLAGGMVGVLEAKEQ